jgi:hypothetical protein
MSFWDSELGVLTGNAEDAFSKSFGLIPDGTTALARILDFKNDAFGGDKTYKIEWLLLEGEFKGQHTFQKIKAFDPEPKVRHKALNMMVLLFKMFNVNKPASGLPPTDDELRVFCNKSAGIKIMETKPNDEGKVYNFVGEVHPAEGFKSVTGEKRVVASRIVTHDDGLESALTRQRKHQQEQKLDDDIPW